MSMDPYNISTDPESLRKAILDLRAEYDAHNHDGASSKSFQTLVAETISARALSIRKTSFTSTQSGLWAGLVGDTMKFVLGSSTIKLSWDGSALTVQGGSIQTSATGERIVINGPTNKIEFYTAGNAKVGEIEPDTSGSINGMILRSYYTDGSDGSEIRLLADFTNQDKHIQMRVDTIEGIDIDYVESEGYATFDFNAAIETGGDLNFEADETSDIGSSGAKADDIWCATIHRTTESSPSDRTLKEDIRDIHRGLEDVLKIQPRRFRWKKDGKEGFGFIAQEIQEILPEMVGPIMVKEKLEIEKKMVQFVTKDAKGKDVIQEKEITVKKKRDETGKKIVRRKLPILRDDGQPLLAIDYGLMMPMLIKAIQELNEKVDKLGDK
jgi:hypothetical protein